MGDAAFPRRPPPTLVVIAGLVPATPIMWRGRVLIILLRHKRR